MAGQEVQFFGPQPAELWRRRAGQDVADADAEHALWLVLKRQLVVDRPGENGRAVVGEHAPRQRRPAALGPIPRVQDGPDKALVELMIGSSLLAFRDRLANVVSQTQALEDDALGSEVGHFVEAHVALEDVGQLVDRGR